MLNYTENKIWTPAIQLVGTSGDLVLGGLGGPANLASQGLADRTAYLYDINGRIERVTTYNNTAGDTVSPTIADLTRTLYQVYQGSNTTVTINLPACTSYASTGAIVRIKRVWAGVNQKPVTITGAAGDLLYDRTGLPQYSAYLHNAESITLICTSITPGSTGWMIAHFDGNHYQAGDMMMGYYQKQGTLIREGQLLNRADYPRLWNWVNGFFSPIDDTTWAGNPDNQGRFSYGNGTTTFRLPDDRGYFERALDLGSGIDADRTTAGTASAVGSRQGDAFKSHAHELDLTIGAGATGGSIINTSASGSGGSYVNTSAIQPTGGSETRPLNVGRLPLIIY